MNVIHGLAAGVLMTVAVGCTSGPPSSAVTGDGSPAASASPPLSPSPSPSQTPARSLRAQPSPVPGAFPPAGGLAIGRHEFSQNGVSFSLGVPTTGWSSRGIIMAPDGGSLSKEAGNATGQKIWMILWSIDGVYDDPCGQAARPLYEAALAATPDDAELLSDYGYLLECHGRRGIAAGVAAYGRAIDQDTDWAKPRYQLMAAAAALGEPEEANAAHRSRVEANPRRRCRPPTARVRLSRRAPLRRGRRRPRAPA